jgi:glycosyltransferase involved in cell wall biosynthesis
LEATAPPNVDFRGTVSPEAISHLLRGARALLLPTRCNEGGPRSVIEAYAAGVPVLATRLGALSEMVDDGVSGMLIPPRSSDAWINAVYALSDDPTAERFGSAAVQLWSQQYSPAKGIETLQKAYLAAGRR